MDVLKFKETIGYERTGEDKIETVTEAEIVTSLEGIVSDEGEVTYDELKSARRINREKVNIIVAGRTGVGKSSLINYIFGKEVAKVGEGEPVTQEIEAFNLERDNITLFDTKGIETKDYTSTLENIRSFLKLKQLGKDENEHIHIGWFCISERGDRIEGADLELLKILTEVGIPVIGVFTKRNSTRSSRFVDKVIEERMLPEVKSVVRVRSIEEEVELEDDMARLSPKGAEELLSETYKHVSEAKQNAIRKAQIAVIKDRIEAMQKEAAQVTNRYVMIAAGIGAVPLPIADSIALAALQTKMVVDINTIYRVDAGIHTFTDIAAALISITGVAQVGKLATGMLKVIPVAGWIINGGVAAGITKGIGYGYSEYLKSNMDKETGTVKLNFDDLKENFMKFFEKFRG